MHQYDKLSGYIKQGREKVVSCARRMIVRHTRAELHLPEREIKTKSWRGNSLAKHSMNVRFCHQKVSSPNRNTEYNKLLINTLSLAPKKIYACNRLEPVNTTVGGEKMLHYLQRHSIKERGDKNIN
jgi:hypothetical protein